MGLHNRSALICLCSSFLLHVFVLWICLQAQEPAKKREMSKEIFQVQLLSNQITPTLDANAEDISSANGTGEHFSATDQYSLAGTKPSIDSPEKIYASEDELEQKPYPLAPVIVPYPDTVPGRHKGSVTLHLFIDGNGVVERGEVVRSDLLPEFGRSALEAFQKAKMHPGIKDGSPTKTKFVVWVDFDSEQ